MPGEFVRQLKIYTKDRPQPPVPAENPAPADDDRRLIGEYAGVLARPSADGVIDFHLKKRVIPALQKAAAGITLEGPEKTVVQEHLSAVISKPNSLSLQLLQALRTVLDPAMKGADPDRNGGIDLNSANLNMLIKRDARLPGGASGGQGKGVPLPLVQQDLAQLSQVEGFVPLIKEISPLTALPILNELRQKLQ